MATEAKASRILVADDELHSLTILRDFLDARGYDVVTAMDGDEALDRFEKDGPFDLVLLDVMMPGQNGWEVCKKVKASSQVPVLMVSALGQPEHIERGRTEGADDYLVKPVRFLDLDARVHAMLGSGERGERLRETLKPSSTSEVTSPIDTLTGLFNKSYFEERLDREYHRSRLHRGQIALLVIEPDADSMPGAAERDLALCRIARAIGDAILPRDVACRVDGGRFAVIACGARKREAQRLAEMIRWGIERGLRTPEGRTGATASVGVAHKEHLEPRAPAEQLYTLAGEALDLAHTLGPNRVVDAGSLGDNGADPIKTPTE